MMTKLPTVKALVDNMRFDVLISEEPSFIEVDCPILQFDAYSITVHNPKTRVNVKVGLKTGCRSPLVIEAEEAQRGHKKAHEWLNSRVDTVG